jgi:hypothetical protein
MLLATGFDEGENALGKKTAHVRLSAMRSPPPGHGMTQSAFGTIVSRFNPRYGGGGLIGVTGQIPTSTAPTMCPVRAGENPLKDIILFDYVP